MTYKPSPTPNDIRLAFLSTQQSIMLLKTFPPIVLDGVKFYDVDDKDRTHPFDAGEALNALQEDMWELVQVWVQWKAAQRGPRELETI